MISISMYSFRPSKIPLPVDLLGVRLGISLLLYYYHVADVGKINNCGIIKSYQNTYSMEMLVFGDVPR